MAIQRHYAPTPFLLLPKLGQLSTVPNLNYPFVSSSGVGTSLFRKGRACLSYVLDLMKQAKPERDEVVIPAYNARSLAFATVHCGLKIRLVDLDRETFFPGVEAIQEVLSDRTLAVMMPYNWGVIPSVVTLGRIHSLLLEREVFWIDDFASTIPGENFVGYFNERSPCMFFSYGKTKIMSIMDGGYAFFPDKHPYFKYFEASLLEDNKPLASSLNSDDIVRLLSNIVYRFYCTRPGFTLLSKLGLTAKDRPPLDLRVDTRPLASGWSRTLESIIEQHYESCAAGRRKVFQQFSERLAPLAGEQMQLFGCADNAGSRFPILFANKELRNRAKSMLEKAYVGASLGHICWLGAIDFLEPYLSDEDPSKFPVSLEYQDRFLTLPAHQEVSESDVDFTVDLIAQCLQQVRI